MSTLLLSVHVVSSYGLTQVPAVILQDAPVSTFWPSRFSTYSLQGKKKRAVSVCGKNEHRITRQNIRDAVMWCIVLPSVAAAVVDLFPVRKLGARVTVARAGVCNLEAVEVALSGASAGNAGLRCAKRRRPISLAHEAVKGQIDPTGSGIGAARARVTAARRLTMRILAAWGCQRTELQRTEGCGSLQISTSAREEPRGPRILL